VLGIFLDTETNGLNILKHKMIEIAFKILDMANGHLVEGFHSVIAISPSDWEKSDPASLKINGFSWQDASSTAFPAMPLCGEKLSLSVKTPPSTAPFLPSLSIPIPRKNFCGPTTGSTSHQCIG
jgi:hypothetical protein